MITIPENIVSDLLSAVGSIMDGVRPAIVVILGISVAFYVARELKRLMPKTGK